MSFLNTYYHRLVDQVHQLHVINDTSLMSSDSTQENEKKGKRLKIVELLKSQRYRALQVQETRIQFLVMFLTMVC